MSCTSISLPWESVYPFSSLLPSIPTWYPSLGCLAQKENARTCRQAVGWHYSSDLQQYWWMTAELRGDAGGWHWLQEGCWWLSWGRSEHAVCIGSLPLSIIEKKKRDEKKKKVVRHPNHPKVRSFTEILKIQFATPNSNSNRNEYVHGLWVLNFNYNL